MKEDFLKKWSNWWILARNAKELNESFAKELDAVIAHESALRQPPVSGACEHPYYSVLGDGEMQPAKCLKCGKVL